MANPALLPQEEEHFPMRTVAAITGINPVTLRAWERRYGLIRPARTDKGHRIYTRGDIETISRIIRLLDRGIAISQVANSLEARAPAADRKKPQATEGAWTGQHERVIDAISRFDENQLEALYNRALAVYPIDVVTDHLLLPVLEALGERWEHHQGSIAEEHFFGAFMRNKLGARFHHRSSTGDGARLLVCCLPGEHHEIGAMLFSLAAHDHGYRVVYLGPDMPLGELAAAAQRAGCDGIVLSGSVEPDSRMLSRELPALVNRAACPVFVGGPSSARHSDAIERAGARTLGTEIRTSIRRIESILQSPDA